MLWQWLRWNFRGKFMILRHCISRSVILSPERRLRNTTVRVAVVPATNLVDRIPPRRGSERRMLRIRRNFSGRTIFEIVAAIGIAPRRDVPPMRTPLSPPSVSILLPVFVGGTGVSSHEVSRGHRSQRCRQRRRDGQRRGQRGFFHGEWLEGRGEAGKFVEGRGIHGVHGGGQVSGRDAAWMKYDCGLCTRRRRGSRE